MHIYSFNNLKFTLKHDRLQHRRLVACVIAQEYSPSTSVQLPFFSRKELLGTLFENVIFLVFLVLKNSFQQ
jgi:hypothetical protein